MLLRIRGNARFRRLEALIFSGVIARGEGGINRIFRVARFFVKIGKHAKIRRLIRRSRRKNISAGEDEQRDILRSKIGR